MESLIIEFEIDDAQLISVNDQYIHPVRKSKNGRYFSVFVSSNELNALRDFYRETFIKVIPKESVDNLKDYLNDNENMGLLLEIVIGIPEQRYRRKKCFYDVDVTNYIKAFEDCIVEYTGIDDSKHYKVITEKQIYKPTDDRYRWIVRTKISPYKLQEYTKLV